MHVRPDDSRDYYIATKTDKTTADLIEFAIADAAATVAAAAFLI